MDIDTIKNWGGNNIETVSEFLSFIIKGNFPKSDMDKIYEYLSDCQEIIENHIEALELFKNTLSIKDEAYDNAFEEKKYDLMLTEQNILQVMITIKKL